MNLRTRSEQLIIKEVLSNPGGVHDIMDRVDFNMFIDPTTKLIFEAITDLYLNHEPINITTINDSIKKSKSIYNKEAIVEMSKIISMSCAVNEYESCIDSLVAEAIRSEHVELAGKLSLMSNRDDYDPNVVINLVDKFTSRHLSGCDSAGQGRHSTCGSQCELLDIGLTA